MYKLIFDVDMQGEPEAIAEALRQIAEDIDCGMESGLTDFGAWLLRDPDEPEDEEDEDEPDTFDDMEDAEEYQPTSDELLESYEDPYMDEYGKNKRRRGSSDYDENDAAWED